MRRLPVIEGQPLDVDAVTAQAIRQRLENLRNELRPRISFLTGGEAAPVVQNLIGSVQVSPDLVLDVQPKTEPGGNWAAAVIDLLTDERVSFESETKRAERASRIVLADALAGRYVDLLERALRREGPLTMLERRSTSRPALAGRLDVTAWVQHRVLNPGVFPQLETVLSVHNPFTSAMAWVAEALALRTTDARLASRLRSVAMRLRPGHALHATVDPGVALRDVPAQWRAYIPAWTIARAVIRRIAPLHRSGALDGLGLAIEPWPLLERLLVRSITAAASQAQSQGMPLNARGHSNHALLIPEVIQKESSLERLARPYGVEPDGSLWLNGSIVATFEAKYSSINSGKTFRSHYFQALTTAAALDSPLAVLVYPEAAEPVSWTVSGFDGRPQRLVAIGLDMFGYERGTGDEQRGTRLLDVVSGVRPVA